LLPKNAPVTEPFDEEYFASTILRNNELCGIVENESRYLEITEFELNVLKLGDTRAFRGIFGPDALSRHTLYPIAILFDRVRYRSASVLPRGPFRVCAQCVIEDVQRLGTAYIHRTHVTPGPLGVEVCHRHASPLLENCPTCKVTLQRHKITKLSSCLTHERYGKAHAVQSSSEHNYSKFVYDVLNLPSPEKFRVFSIPAINRSLEVQGYETPSISSYFQFCINEDPTTAIDERVYMQAEAAIKSSPRTPMQLFTRVAYLLYGNLDNFMTAMNDCRADND